MKTNPEMVAERSQLMLDKMKMDRFFSLYLDKFGSKMDADKPDTKIWALYKSKLKEYSEIERQIKILNYYINATT
jgi:hypothetical protein